MIALVQTGYGSADVLELREAGKPAPGEGEVLIRVEATSISAGDIYRMRGKPFPARLVVGFPKPKKDYVVGLDFAGVVESVGNKVLDFHPGDEVYGECRGACAEYAVAKEGSIARKPRSYSYVQAAAVPTSACTALEGLRDQGKIRPGQKALINGASGGVGPFAVQIAKALGAQVTAVCGTRNAEMALLIGADRVIDYSSEDFTRGGPCFDLILDNVGSHPLAETRRALRPQGLHIPISGQAGMGWIMAAALESLFVRQQGSPFEAHTTGKNLLALNELIEAGKIVPVIDRSYSLGEAREAFRYLSEGHARGKVLITARHE